jgi:hypothetical protein
MGERQARFRTGWSHAEEAQTPTEKIKEGEPAFRSEQCSSVGWSSLIGEFSLG